jgi:D-alanyl-D-alanine carboxypeptidase
LNIDRFFFKVPIFHMTWKLFLPLIIAFSSGVDAQPLKVNSQAQSALLINPENGAILYEKSPDTSLYPASICKIATSLFLLEGKKVDLNEEVVASKEALAVMEASVRQADIDAFPPYRLEHDGKTLHLAPGESLSVEKLLKGVMIYSANDAANVLAEHASGSIDRFMEELNAYLLSLGCTGTHMVNPHGLFHPKQVTTASDMARIATLALKNQKLSELMVMPSFGLTTSRKESELTLYHSNRLIRNGKHHYSPAIGLKIGYIQKSGFNIVAAAEREGRRLILVLMGCKKHAEMFNDAKAIFEQAFSQKLESRKLFSEAQEVFSTQVPRAKRDLRAKLKEDVVVSYYPAEELALQPQVHWDGAMLPVAKGERVAELRLLDDKGVIHYAYPLFASDNLEASFFYRALAMWPWIMGGTVALGALSLARRRRKASGQGPRTLLG